MNRRSNISLFFLALFCLISFSGCGSQAEMPAAEQTTPPVSVQPVPSASASPSPSPSVSPSPKVSPVPDEILTVQAREDIKNELMDAMIQLRQPRTMDLSALDLERPDLYIKNIYYEITSEHPELKYTFDLIVRLQDEEADCQLCYMPYKTGAFPDGFLGDEAATLEELIAVAESHLGAEPAPIRITDTTLDPDTMNRALQQVGGGYILCQLSPDGTELRYTPGSGMTMEECLAALSLADELTDQVVARVIKEGMTLRERAEALYSYVTQTVSYDQRYYSDRASMPYESQTALGALRDGVAICGGYSNAVKLLFEKAGIPCYNVTGRYFSENYMWNVAKLDGEWLWFDATADRGSSGEFGFLRFALEELDPTMYRWAESSIQPLLN